MHTILMVSTLLLSLMRGVWFIEPEAASAYLPVVSALMKPGSAADFSKLLPASSNRFKNWAAPVNADANLVNPDYRYGFKGITTKNSIAIIPMNGAIMKYDNCGDPGTKTLASYFIEVENNPAFIGSILISDTPGGSADGTGQLSELIYSLKKPVVTYIDGMMCSAGYWIGSAADEIVMGYKTDIVGSIGTYLTLPDWSKQLEQEGIVLHEIYATKSTEKNGVWKEALSGNYEPIRKQLIDPYNESFLAGVKRNRYGKGLSSKALKGATYMADAVDVGLIDAIGNFDYAVERVKKLSKA